MGLQTGMLPSRRAVIGDEIDGLGFAHSVAFVEDDDASEVPSIEAHLRVCRFPYRESCASADHEAPRSALCASRRCCRRNGAFFPARETSHRARRSSVAGFPYREITHRSLHLAGEIECVAGRGRSGRWASSAGFSREGNQRYSFACVVVVLDPTRELLVEYRDVGEVESARQKALPDGAEEALDFAFRSGVADGCMAAEQAGESKPVSEHAFESGMTTWSPPQNASHKTLSELSKAPNSHSQARHDAPEAHKTGEKGSPRHQNRAADTRLPPRPATASSRDPKQPLRSRRNWSGVPRTRCINTVSPTSPPHRTLASWRQRSLISGTSSGPISASSCA